LLGFLICYRHKVNGTIPEVVTGKSIGSFLEL
jgi:hypothetical protein